MKKHRDCKIKCQQADDYGVWPEHSCSPICVRMNMEMKPVAQVVALEPDGPDKVMLTLQDLHVLAQTAERNGTQHNFPAVALQWAAAALGAKNEAESRELKAAQEADELRATLRELVALADMKTRLQGLHDMGHGTDWDGYHERNREAWVAARIAALGA